MGFLGYWVSRTCSPIEKVLLDWLSQTAIEISVTMLPDEQVVALAYAQMSDQEQTALSELLAKQREGALDAMSRYRLDELMRPYRRGMVRKAQALQVAVKRGLQALLS